MAKREQFRFFTLFQRTTAVMDDDALVLLDHQYAKDRIRRIPFDQVECVLHWDRLAASRLTLFFLLFIGCAIGGIACLAHRHSDGVPSLVFGIILLVCAAVMLILIGITLAMGRHHLMICRAGLKMQVSGIMRTAKFQRLLTDITSRTREIQARLATAAAVGVGPTELALPTNSIPVASDPPIVEPSPSESDT